MMYLLEEGGKSLGNASLLQSSPDIDRSYGIIQLGIAIHLSL